MFPRINKIRSFLMSLLRPRGKDKFIRVIKKKGVVLDVGCGNNSPLKIKTIRPDLYYVGIDIVSEHKNPILYADEILLSLPTDFADIIAGKKEIFDAVVSSHNLEHCNHPFKVLDAICNSLKHGGLLYLSFPNPESIQFPSRGGTLNFYDDSTHKNLLNYAQILEIINKNNLSVIYAQQAYKPMPLRFFGLILEPLSKLLNRNMPFGFTWAYWGFESIIWAYKH